MLELKIYEKHLDKYKTGYPLLFKEAIMGSHLIEQNNLSEGALLKLTDEKNRFIATAYYGVQNKGIGWILSYNVNEVIGPEFFKRKLMSALEKRLGLYNNPKTTAYRIFNGEGDGIGGLTIDYFEGYYLLSWYSKGIYAYRDIIVDTLKTLVEYDGFYEKLRFDTELSESEEDGFICGTKATFPLVVKENGVKLAVYFNDGAMVGFFMDQREVRRSIRNNYAKNKTVLNTFSYTGAFSVFAALGGAKKTVSVDLSGRSRERTLEHFALNDINPDSHEIRVEDVFNYFGWAFKKGLKYDMVILDPPSFAKSKDYVFSAEKDYPELLASAVQITVNGGIIVASTNASTIDMAKFKQMVGRAFQLANSRFEILEMYQLPKDYRVNRNYPQGDYLKVLVIKVDRKKG